MPENNEEVTDQELIELDDLLEPDEDDIADLEEPVARTAPAPEPKKRGRPRAKTTPDEPLAGGGSRDATDEELIAAENAGTIPRSPLTETPEQKRIRELEALLAAPSPKDARPRDESTLSPEEKKIRELEDRLARKQANDLALAGTKYQPPTGDGEHILFHMTADGLIFNGIITYKGQEFEVVVGSKAYEQTKNRNGDTWLDLLDDVDGQYERWGQQRIARGPWRGRKWGDASTLTDAQDIADAKAAAERERKRNRAAPVFA